MSADRRNSDRRQNIDRRAPAKERTISLKIFIITITVLVAIFATILILITINYRIKLNSFLEDDIIDLTTIPEIDLTMNEYTPNNAIDNLNTLE